MLIVAGMILGLVAGSFLATLVVRWPRGETLTGRSACDHCGQQLRAADLIPLFSFLVQRGRCRHCANPINWRHPAIELACALVGGLALWVEPSAQGFAGALLGWLLITLILLDAEHYWLPDAITLPLLALGLLFGHGSLTDRLIGALAGGGALLALALAYRAIRHREGLGMGDVKLVAALGAWLGWQALPPLILLSATIGLVWAGTRMLRGEKPAGTMQLPLGSCLGMAGMALWFVGAG